MYIQGRLAGNSRACAVGRTVRWCWLSVLLCLQFGVPAYADEAGEFSVVDAHSRAIGGVQLLDARFAIRLSSGAREALENGVPLTFELQVQLVKQHKWLWDAVESEHVVVRQLQYHALSRSYLVKTLGGSGTQGNYTRLGDALAAAGSIDKMLVTSEPLEGGFNYYIRLRGSLDIEALPTPVRLLAYVSSDWDMNSEWYAWQIDR
jgi:Domain of unknown function (DUF4390)